VDDDTARLLERFVTSAGQAVPLVAVWAHGSLALGDYQPGRSDLDLLAVVPTAVTSAQRAHLQAAHEALIRDAPLAAHLHCSYLAQDDLTDPAAGHVTWAHEELFARPVSPVTRRELAQGALVLHGPGPDGLVPPVSDGTLTAYIREDLRSFWFPATASHRVWREDIWVDLGLLTPARAAVTLAEGRLITKQEALAVLPALGAPVAVVADIQQRRYAHPSPISARWRTRRGLLAQHWARDAIQHILAS